MNLKNWANNKPFKGGKGSFLEGGIHVPFIFYWQDGLNSGVIYDGLVSALDIAPTRISVAGTEAHNFDGVNINLHIYRVKLPDRQERPYFGENLKVFVGLYVQ